MQKQQIQAQYIVTRNVDADSEYTYAVTVHFLPAIHPTSMMQKTRWRGEWKDPSCECFESE